MKPRLSVPAALLILSVCVPVFAQTAPAPSGTTTATGLTLSDTLIGLTQPVGSAAAGAAIGLATQIEVATSPLGTSAAGFVFKLDPATGLKVRTATTFGPSFAERALTSGEGKVSIDVNFLSANYEKLGDLSLKQMRLGFVNTSSDTLPKAGFESLVLSSETLVMSGMIGITDDIDIGVAVPLVQVKLNGTSWVQNGRGDILLLAKGSGASSGVGDIAAIAKYRFYSFGKGQPDPGGIAIAGVMRLPTGDPANFRGLGVTRTLLSLIASGGQGRFRPHANAGFEYWSDGVSVVTDFQGLRSVTARHQVQYAAGLEFEATPKVTLLFDFLGRDIHHAGTVGFETNIPASPAFGVSSFESAVALPQGNRKLALIPGLKVNLKGKMLLSVNGIVSIHDRGLHDRFIPVVGIETNF